MHCGNRTPHSSFSMTVGITALVVTGLAVIGGTLFLASCATSGTKSRSEPTTSTTETASSAKTTDGATADEPPAPESTATTIPESGEESAPDREEDAHHTIAAPGSTPAYPGTQEHIQKIESGLKPLRSIPSKPE